MNVLIVEDDINLNNEIQSFCAEHANKILSTYDGLEAVELIDSNRFDLFIININLPNMNGLDIIKYIRKTDMDTPIVVITGNRDIDVLKSAYENGCNEYIKKPFELEELEIRVKNVITKKQDTFIYFNNDFYHNLEENNFYYKDRMIDLRYKEKRFCNLLMKNIGKVVHNTSIHDYVWENEIKDVYPLRQLVAELRKKLPYDIIITKPKEGYYIEPTLCQL